MTTRAVQFVATYGAWDTSANAWKTGDSANHSMSWVKDGTRSATTNAVAEIDSTNCPGQYKVTITSTEADCLSGLLAGKSSTANIQIIPTSYTFEQIPNAVAGASGGLLIAGSNAATTFSGLTTGAISATTITASGAVAFQSTFAVTGTTTLTGAVSLGSTLGVTGTTTLAAVATGTITTTGNVSVSGTTTLTGAVTATNASNSIILGATQNNAGADALLNRDMSAVSDTNSRSPLNGLRALRNKWTNSGGTYTVYKEDDTASAWTSALSTDAAAVPIISSDPA